MYHSLHVVVVAWMYINILLATDDNKYSPAFAVPTNMTDQVGELGLFLAVAKDYGIVMYLNQSQQMISPCFG